MTETLNETIERHILAVLAELPKGKKAKLKDVVERVIHELHAAKIKDVPQAKVYDLVSQTLGRLKTAGKVYYASGRGCGWKLLP